MVGCYSFFFLLARAKTHFSKQSTTVEHSLLMGLEHPHFQGMCTHTHTHACMHVRTHARTRARARTHTHTHTHTCMHTHTTHTHTHTKKKYEILNWVSLSEPHMVLKTSLLSVYCVNSNVSMDTKFKTLTMNSHNKDGDHSWTCLSNSYSDGGYHTTLWQVSDLICRC